MSTSDEPGTYELVRRRFADVAATWTPQQAATVVPATPDWTVHDVIAHLVGLAADLNAPRFPTADCSGARPSATSSATSSPMCSTSLSEVLADVYDGTPYSFPAG